MRSNGSEATLEPPGSKGSPPGVTDAFLPAFALPIAARAPLCPRPPRPGPTRGELSSFAGPLDLDSSPVSKSWVADAS